MQTRQNSWNDLCCSNTAHSSSLAVLFLVNQGFGRKNYRCFTTFYDSFSSVASSILHDVLLVLRGLADNLRRRGDELL